MDRYQKAQMAGADAFKRGASVIDCPHSGRLGAHWRLGWHRAAMAAHGEE
jgi:hypothetical protein